MRLHGSASGSIGSGCFSSSFPFTFAYTFVQPRATYSSQPAALPDHHTFAHSGNSRAAGSSKSAPWYLPSFRLLFNPSTKIAPQAAYPFSYLVGGFDVCIIFPYTQFVNRLILLFSKLHFVHDKSPNFRPAGCAFRKRVILFQVLLLPIRTVCWVIFKPYVIKRQNFSGIIKMCFIRKRQLSPRLCSI